mmetsp:Transcript_4766/g.17335  ORF Transcript_4766/g.17335 Transcript_4766/m.17335 type:complete len:254 (+) Transcript_4766:441-1202(+)
MRSRNGPSAARMNPLGATRGVSSSSSSSSSVSLSSSPLRAYTPTCDSPTNTSPMILSVNCAHAASAIASVQRETNFSNFSARASKTTSPPNSKTDVSSAMARHMCATNAQALIALAMTCVPFDPARQLPLAATSEPKPRVPTARRSHASKKSSSTGAATRLIKYNRQSTRDSPCAPSMAFLISPNIISATLGALNSTSPSSMSAKTRLVQRFSSRHAALERSSACSNSMPIQASACAWLCNNASSVRGVSLVA